MNRCILSVNLSPLTFQTKDSSCLARNCPYQRFLSSPDLRQGKDLLSRLCPVVEDLKPTKTKV